MEGRAGTADFDRLGAPLCPRCLITKAQRLLPKYLTLKHSPLHRCSGVLVQCMAISCLSKRSINLPNVSSRAHAAAKKVLLLPSPHGWVTAQTSLPPWNSRPPEPPGAALSCPCALGGPQETYMSTLLPTPAPHRELKQQESQELLVH